MCGIAGIIGAGASGKSIDGMLSLMHHRGPDGDGVWKSPGGSCVLGHKRLSIIDIAGSPQPMASPDGRYHIVFNGEIYNYLELRPELERQGWVFATKGDSEVLLAGLVLQGTSFLDAITGMFAFALWDEQEQSLLLARDRVGIKPLYYGYDEADRLVLGSELKSVVHGRASGFKVNPLALDYYLSLRYVPGPLTMVEGISKFPTGHWGLWKNGKLTLNRYWDISFVAKPPADGPSYTEAVDEVERLLSNAVRLRMRSDVPYGAFLSGGVDSAVVTALMASHTDKPVKTYSVGFDDFEDECDDARAMARALGADHTEFSLRPDDLYDLGDVAWSIDEPFPDPIVLAMHKLAEKAQKDVKVILTGEGADELFGGYVHHPHMALLDRMFKWLPSPALKLGGAMAASLPMFVIDRLFNYPQSPGKQGRARLKGLLVSAKEPLQRYLTYVSLLSEQERRVLLSPSLEDELPSLEERLQPLQRFFDRPEKGDDSAALWKLEYKMWLADNILFKQDKALMGCSIEGRVPFCDHHLVEFASKLPFDYKIAEGINKRVLRSVADKRLPPVEGTTKKKAFMVPLTGAYGKITVEIAEDVLGKKGLASRGLFREDALQELMRSVSNPSFLAGKQIMALVMFELWMRAMEKVGSPA